MKAEDKRRYPRVFLDKSLGEFKELLGVQVRWPGGDVGGILDISYVGAALSKPAGLQIPFTPNELLPLEFVFSNDTVKINAFFARQIEHAVGVYFQNLSTEANLELSKFLKEKMLGLNTRFIQPHFYSSNQDFTYWYHGPNDTNVFIWENDNRLIKASVELGAQVLFYEDDRLSYSKVSQWVDNLSQDYAYYVQYLDDLAELPSEELFFNRVISVLTQIKENRESIDRLLNALKNTPK